MKIPAIDEPIRLGLSFWLLYLLLAVPSLWILQPWSWGPPVSSMIAGMILPPFLASIVLYSFTLFTLSLTCNFRAQGRALAEFAAAIVAPSVFLFTAWIYSGYRNLPSNAAFIASFIGYSMLYRMYRKRPNRAPEPTTVAHLER